MKSNLMYRSVYLIRKYGNFHEITFDSDQEHSPDDLNQFREVLLILFDCDEINIVMKEKNTPHQYIIQP